jgi:hypothetical protein
MVDVKISAFSKQAREQGLEQTLSLVTLIFIKEKCRHIKKQMKFDYRWSWR